MRRWAAVLVAVVAVGVAAGCGVEEDAAAPAAPEPPAQTAPEPRAQTASEPPAQTAAEPESRCALVPPATRASLTDALAAGARISRISAVESDGGDGAAPFDDGLYFLSAALEPQGRIATWAVDGRYLRTGGGYVIGVGPVARQVTELGVDVDPGVFGIDDLTDGWTESVLCARGEG